MSYFKHLLNLPLYYERPGAGDLAPLVDDLDALSPGQGRGLHNPPALPALSLPNLAQQLGVCGKTERSGKKIKLRLSMFQHELVVILPQSVFSSNIECSCKQHKLMS